MDSHTAAVVIIAVVVIAAIAILGWLYWRQHHSLALRKRFGPEYDRVVQQEGNQRKAEGVLDIRAMRRKKLQIHPLDPMQRNAFANRWTEVQSRFVDDPQGAVVDADQLVNELMSARGYPMADFNQRADDISVDHPQVVEHYRSAHDIAARHSRGQADTEDLRNALVHYRWLYEELLEDRTQPRKEKLA